MLTLAVAIRGRRAVASPATATADVPEWVRELEPAVAPPEVVEAA